MSHTIEAERFNLSANLVLYSTRVAVAQEMHDPDLDMSRVFGSGNAWSDANLFLEKCKQLNPEKALELAVELTVLPDPNGEYGRGVIAWTRTSGLSALGLDGFEQPLAEYLESGERRDVLFEALKANMDLDVSGIETIEDLGDSAGFTAVQSFYICLGFRDTKGEKARELYESARKNILDPDAARVAGLLKSVSDCAYLNQRL